MNNKIIFLLSIAVISLFLFGCSSQQPEGLPEPAGTGSALAGQGFATGVYDREYQLYNRMNADGSVSVSLVQGENWISLGRLTTGQGASSVAADLTVSALPMTQPVSSSMTGRRLRLDSATCNDYDIEFNSNGNYLVTQFWSGGSLQDSFVVPRNRAQPIRQIAGTNDAITVHLTTSRASWFTLHCDRGTIAPTPIPTPVGNLCGNSILESGEICDDGNTNYGDGCSGNCLNFCRRIPELGAIEVRNLNGTVIQQSACFTYVPSNLFNVTCSRFDDVLDRDYAIAPTDCGSLRCVETDVQVSVAGGGLPRSSVNSAGTATIRRAVCQ